MLVGYMRVSSDTDRQTTDLQRDALLAAGVDERHLFSDRASGTKDDRPGLEKALGFVLPGDCLVVWKLDRLGRSLPHLLKIVAGLREHGVGFRSLTEQMDTTTPNGELFFHIFGALAQYERALARERSSRTVRRQTPGRRGGRPLSVEAEKLESVIAALEHGTSKAAVCRTFGIPRSTLNDTLARVGWAGRGAQCVNRLIHPPKQNPAASLSHRHLPVFTSFGYACGRSAPSSGDACWCGATARLRTFTTPSRLPWAGRIRTCTGSGFTAKTTALPTWVAFHSPMIQARCAWPISGSACGNGFSTSTISTTFGSTTYGLSRFSDWTETSLSGVHSRSAGQPARGLRRPARFPTRARGARRDTPEPVADGRGDRGRRLGLGGHP